MAKSKKKNYTGLFILLGALLLIGFIGFFASKDVSFLDKFKSNNTQKKLVEPKYEELSAEAKAHVDASLAKVKEANTIAEKPVKSDEDNKEMARLVQEAIDEAIKAKDVEPTNSIVWGNLGNIYVGMGSTEGAQQFAISSYQKAIEINPTVTTYYGGLGGAYLNLKQYDKAIEVFRNETIVSPKYANGFFNLGVAYKRYGAKSKAKEALQKALDLLPANHPDRYKVEAELENL